MTWEPIKTKWTRRQAVCPYCNQGRIMKVIVKKTKEIIYICEECDTVWTTDEAVSESTGVRFDLYAKAKGFADLWSELENTE